MAPPLINRLSDADLEGHRLEELDQAVMTGRRSSGWASLLRRLEKQKRGDAHDDIPGVDDAEKYSKGRSQVTGGLIEGLVGDKLSAPLQDAVGVSQEFDTGFHRKEGKGDPGEDTVRLPRITATDDVEDIPGTVVVEPESLVPAGSPQNVEKGLVALDGDQAGFGVHPPQQGPRENPRPRTVLDHDLSGQQVDPRADFLHGKPGRGHDRSHMPVLQQTAEISESAHDQLLGG